MNDFTKIKIKIDRQTMDNTSIDLPRFIDSVYRSLMANYQLFGAEKEYDLGLEELTLSSIVVMDHKSRAYIRADVKTDDKGNVSFANVEQVTRQWVPISDEIKRSEFYTVEMAQRKNTFWTGILQ